MIQHIVRNHRIGIFIVLFLIAFPVTSHALCQVTLQWNANNPAPDGYFVFGREAGQSYDYNNPWWQGDASFTQCTIDDLQEDKTYFFVVRAYVGNSESGNSNEARFAFNENSSSLSSSNGSGGSGGGSGGGCFIQSMWESLQ